MKNYALAEVEKIIQRYIDSGGHYTIIEEGVLGWGTVVCEGDRLKTAIIKEVYINSQSSSHTIRMYNSIPKVWKDKVVKTQNDSYESTNF